MVGTRIPKDILKGVTEENGVKYVLRESGVWAANEVGTYPDDVIIVDHELSDHPKDSRDWFSTVYLLCLQEVEVVKTSSYVCESKVVSIDETFLLPRDASIIDVSKTCPLSCEGRKYKIMYLIPRQKSEKQWGVYDHL